MDDVIKIKQTMQKERINANNTKKQKKMALKKLEETAVPTISSEPLT